MPLIEAINLSKSYDAMMVLSDISISVESGEIISLLGASGVGKSTLFNLLSGLEKPDHGKIYLQGEDITGKPGGLGYMMQNDLLMPHKNILDNIALPLLIKGHAAKEARGKAHSLLKQFELDKYASFYPKALSGGMRQRVAILRTYIVSKRAMLFDEPFSALDPMMKSLMHTWFLKALRQLHSAVIFITHDIDEAMFLSDRIYVLRGSPANISGGITTTEATAKSQIIDLMMP